MVATVISYIGGNRMKRPTKLWMEKRRELKVLGYLILSGTITEKERLQIKELQEWLDLHTDQGPVVKHLTK